MEIYFTYLEDLEEAFRNNCCNNRADKDSSPEVFNTIVLKLKKNLLLLQYDFSCFLTLINVPIKTVATTISILDMARTKSPTELTATALSAFAASSLTARLPDLKNGCPCIAKK